MKRLSILLMVCVLLSASGICSIVRENKSNYSNVLLSTSTAVTVSSFTVTTSADMGHSGLKRIFKIDGSTSGTLYYQLGGSTTTITTVGLPLEDDYYYIEDSYFGDIYFLTDTSTATLRMVEITKK